MTTSDRKAGQEPRIAGNGTLPAMGPAFPADRHALIVAHVAGLSATAREMAATLPLGADASDFLRVLDEQAEAGASDVEAA